MKLEDATDGYHVGYRHNPKQFYPNSFQVEYCDGKLVLVGRVKRHIGKKFRIVGILKRR